MRIGIALQPFFLLCMVLASLGNDHGISNGVSWDDQGSSLAVSSRVEQHEGMDSSMCSFSPNFDGLQWSRTIISNGSTCPCLGRHAQTKVHSHSIKIAS